MSRTAKRISAIELQQKFDKVLRDSGPSYGSNGHWLMAVRDLPTVAKDLSKVQFDWENYEAGPIQTLANGLTFTLCHAGGDWEWPISFILYWDGKSIRAYIPSAGNHWNKKTKQAFGNDEDVDILEGFTSYEDLQASFKGQNQTLLMIEDIINRIKVVK